MFKAQRLALEIVALGTYKTKTGRLSSGYESGDYYLYDL